MSKPGSNKTRVSLEDEIEVRLANDSDIDNINAFYNRIYSKNRTKEQFVWEFNSSPAGKALYIIAEHGTKIVGTQCAIPYYFVNEKNETILSAKSEDTLVDPEYRGLSIFDKMYFLLFMECRRMGIHILWGFTYAKKPFLNLGFEIPFQTSMGLLVLKPFKAYAYYSKLAKNNSFNRKLKILLLCLKSKVDQIIQSFKINKVLNTREEFIPLNSANLNYLGKNNAIGLKLDMDFFNYRIRNNPYSKNYYQLNIIEQNIINASLIFTVNRGLCYILHMFYTNEEQCAQLIRALMKYKHLKNCFTIRYWGFSHNEESKKEIEIFKSTGYTFLKNGISFVGLSLEGPDVDWKTLHISRLASQGTD
ncbi:MAG: GNAT family N-acetyltransferase [Sphingobacteriaceae bacterium]|nr:GNAT family N-acetyltransferase [Sphingobacteriaceae bacterium]